MDSRTRTLGHRPELDGLRGLAIVLVMLMHTGILANGFVGVDLFFALSGFLITTLLCEEWQHRGAIDLRRFYERRARRLLPALTLVVLFSALTNLFVYRLTGWPFQTKTLTTLLFLNNWVAASGHSAPLGGLNPTWSLAQEEQFYLVWPLLLVWMVRHRFGPRLLCGALVVMIACLVIAAPAVAASIHGFDTYYSPVYRTAELLLGSLAAVVWRHRLLPGRVAFSGWLPESRVGRVANRCANPARSLSCLVPACLFCGLLFLTALPARTVYLSACVLAVVLIINLMELSGARTTGVLRWRPLRRLGRISYALYLFHLPIFDLLQHWFPSASVAEMAVGTFALGVGAAEISWRLVESRFLGSGPRRERKQPGGPLRDPAGAQRQRALPAGAHASRGLA